MAGPDKKRSKKAGGAKGETSKVISTYMVLPTNAISTKGNEEF